MSVVLLATEMESMSESRCSAVPSSRRASLEQYSDRAPLLATIVQLSSLHHLLLVSCGVKGSSDPLMQLHFST
jgi:hypothetical protein